MTNTGSAAQGGRRKSVPFADKNEDTLQEQKSFKGTLEKMLETKFAARKKAEAKFKLDMYMMVTYCFFLVIFTLNATRTDNTVIFQARSEVYQAIDNFEEVAYTTDIYDYLREVIVPVVAADESLLTGSGNLMLNSVTVRQLRVQRAEFNAKPLTGLDTLQWPGFNRKHEETRDGGGTVGEADPDDALVDWPADSEWFSYFACEGLAECFVEDSRALHRGVYPKSGYQATLNGTRLSMLSSIDDLEEHAFFSRDSTAAVFVEFAAWLTSRRLFCIVTILFENEVGGVHSSAVVRVSPFKSTQSAIDSALSILVSVYALGVLMVIDFINMYRSGFVKFWQQGWSYVSFLNYMLFVLSLLLEQQVRSLEVDLRDLVPMSYEAQHFPWQRVANDEQLLQFVTAFNSPLSWLRVLSYLEAISPRTKMLTATIGRASSDLSTLFVIFFIVYFGYAMGFYLAFGAELQAFSTSFLSLTTLFEAILGDFDFDSMYEVHTVLTPLMFTSFFLIVFFVLLNMIMAVVVKTYTETKALLDIKTETEVTGVGILKQQLKDVRKLLGKLVKRKRRRSVAFTRTPSNNSRAHSADSDEEDEHLSVEDVKFLFHGDETILARLGVKSWEELMKAADVNGDGKLSLDEVRDFQVAMMDESQRHRESDKKSKEERRHEREAKLTDLREQFHALAEEGDPDDEALSRESSSRPPRVKSAHSSPIQASAERKAGMRWLDRTRTKSPIRGSRHAWSDSDTEAPDPPNTVPGVNAEIAQILLSSVKELSVHVQTLASEVSGLSGAIQHARAATPRIATRGGSRQSTPLLPTGPTRVVRYAPPFDPETEAKQSTRRVPTTSLQTPLDEDAVVELPGASFAQADAFRAKTAPPRPGSNTAGTTPLVGVQLTNGNGNGRPETPTSQVINATARMLSAVARDRRKPPQQ